MELNQMVERFKAHQKQMHAYSHAMGLLGYDSVTSMPQGASETLGDTLGVLSEAIYRLETDEAYKELLRALYERRGELDFQTRREAEELFEEQRKLSCIPMEEYVAFQVDQNAAQNAWHEAKEKSDYALFKPHLQKMIDFQRKYAQYIAPGKPVYDTLLNEYERGLDVKTADAYFETVKATVVPLVQRIIDKGWQPRCDFLTRKCPIEQQRRLSQYVMGVMTIDPRHCTLGETEHPFTTEFSKNDVRITTHYHEDNMVSNLFSVVHEGGHALYELHVGDELLHSALAHGTSMGVHESQSRFWENIVGRSEPFCDLIFPKVQELFPAQMGDVTAREFWQAVNMAQPSLIRTEADELTYSLHVLIRYELEKRIFAGTLGVDELPQAWNDLYRQYLGVEVPCDREGVLQDSHWSSASFGYFPSYSIGSAYSCQIVASMEKDLPVWELVGKGELAPIVAWLTERIYKWGALITPPEVLRNCCGAAFDPKFYTDYLTAKFTKLYNL